MRRSGLSTGSIGIIALLSLCAPASADSAKGTIVNGKRSATIQYVYLVKGPDAVDPSKLIRELVFSPVDFGAKIQACKSMSCVSGALGDGMTVDLPGDERLNYWVVMNGQRMQYSGTAERSALETSVDQPERISGRLRIDDASAGGPVVDVTFDAALVKEFKDAR
jgi:hypothetical protein